MIILRQKEFTSRKLHAKVRIETAKRNAKFLGRLGKLAKDRTIETGNLMAVRKSTGAKQVASDIVKSNIDTIRSLKDTATSLSSPNLTIGNKAKIIGDIATDLKPGTAIGKRVIQEAHHISSKDGKSVVQSLSELATNPAKKLGSLTAKFRESGSKVLGGKWIGPGVNKYCLGLAPDSALTSIGDQFEAYRGKKALQDEVINLVNSKDGRRFARSYDRLIGNRLNHVHNKIQELPSQIAESLDNIKTQRNSQLNPQFI